MSITEAHNRYGSSPLAFADDLPIRTKDGLRRFGAVKVPAQHEFLEALEPALIGAVEGRQVPVRRFWLEATKGYAKSWMIAATCLWAMAFTKRFVRGQVAAADRDQAAEVRLAANEIIQAVPWLGQMGVEVGKWAISGAFDSTMEIIAADEAGSHGARPDLLVVDELTAVTKEEFVQNLLDNAEKVPHGLVLLTMNAGQVESWQYRLRESVLAQPDWWWFKAVTDPAPYHDERGIADAKRRNSASRFNRLFRGVWAAGGDALDAEDIEAAIDRALRPMDGTEAGFQFHGGLDLGIKHDHAAFTVLGVEPASELVQLADCHSWAPVDGLEGGEVDISLIEWTILRTAERLPLANVMYDPHQASYLAQRLRRQGIHMVEIPFTGKWLDHMASSVLQTFRNRMIKLYHNADLIRDLQRLQIVEKSYGYKLTAIADKAHGHADRAIGLALALLGTEFSIAEFREPIDDGLGDSLLDMLDPFNPYS